VRRLSLRSNKTASQSVEQSTLSVLIFSVSGKEYALPVRSIQEIINCTGYTELPPVNNSAHGVVSLRGVGVPVFDLYSMINSKITNIGKRSCIIILDGADIAKNKKQTTGLLVESVSVVLEIEKNQIEDAPQSGEKADIFSGMFQTNEKFILILNEKKLFGENQFIQNKQLA
jgi:purine-binding chemotaxis protein CheW